MNRTEVAQCRRIRVALVCPWFFKGDAVGASARETFLALKDQADIEITSFWLKNDYDDVIGVKVGGLSDLLLDPRYLDADIIIWVFAVYSALFDAILVGNGKAARIVRFHNVTPKALMPEKHWPVIEKSFVQIANFDFADEIWADSPENIEELSRQGIDIARALLMPLAVDIKPPCSPQSKGSGIIEMLYVGRFFQSKGVLDLLDAIEGLRALTKIPFRLSLVGNIRFSDPDYVEQVKKRTRELDLQGIVTVAGTLSDAELAAAYRRSHIFVTASRHEGFCVPVIEALAAGAIPVSYPISNLRVVAGGLGKLAEDANHPALTRALLSVMQGIRALPDGGKLCLDAGTFSRVEFESRAATYASTYSRDAFIGRISSRVRHSHRNLVRGC